MTDTAAEFARALAAFQAGRIAEAEALLRSLASAEPAFLPALQLMGMIAGSMGRAPEALEWFDRACAIDARGASLRHNRAQALFQLGRAEEARADLEHAVREDPSMHPSWNLLGAVRAVTGDAAGALAAYDRALELKPGHAATIYNRALFMQHAGRTEEAIAGLREALAADPSIAPARTKLAEALNAAGMEAFRAKRAEAAVQRYREALALDPAVKGVRNNLAAALAAADRLDEAAENLRQSLALSPGDADAWSNLGFILSAKGDDAAAAAHFERALSIRPDHADALSNLGQLRQEQGDRAAAKGLFHRALAANPDSAIAGYNLGILELCDLHFAPGWALNELRYRTVPPMATRRHQGIAEFTQEDWGRGGRIGVWGEQGVGDRLVYSTLLPEVEARGEEFILETDARLVAAYRRAHPGWTIVTRDESERAFASCERQIALASLPRLMRGTLESFAGQPQSVLGADPARAAQYRARLASPGARIVAISWRSRQPAARAALQRKKSAPLEAFLAMSRREDMRLVDLQYGDTVAEREDFARKGGRLARLDDLDLFNDLDGVLAAIEACDLVVTTSNVTAHLAGALGKPTLLVYLRANPPFHYWAVTPSGRCLWYPCLTIVTGLELDSWEKVLARAATLSGG